MLVQVGRKLGALLAELTQLGLQVGAADAFGSFLLAFGSHFIDFYEVVVCTGNLAGDDSHEKGILV
ncbi:hypothetical protein D0T11_01910 [Hymenobacter rubripertinctus]|uniref:Uncharacterized protein n=1 Tax=Hymenobacter rubripertinctus TaxID=2029981 RepID=A0A418R8B0_9BACT|nr:hypothetical protein D0T11_01910 [Hymenobacter rubripertinctus]